MDTLATIFGDNYTFATASVGVGDGTNLIELQTFTSIKVGFKQEKKLTNGKGNLPTGIGRGLKEFDFDLQFDVKELFPLMDSINGSVLDLRNLTFIFFLGDDVGTPLRKFVCSGCEFTESSISTKAGDTNAESAHKIICPLAQYVSF